MIGWSVGIYKQEAGGDTPARFTYGRHGIRLAAWETGDVGAPDLFEDLAKEGKAINLGGDGYPYQFTAKVVDLKPLICEKPPCGGEWTFKSEDTRFPAWLSVMNREAFEKCDSDEWLLIEIFDLS
jgi:hypothetical protein